MAATLMRIWRGWTRRSDADAYETYLLRTGLVGYTGVEGNRGVHMTRRDVGDNTEFCLVSLWDSWGAVRSFAGEDPALAVFYPEDDRFLVDRELVVSHYTIFDST
ncbi:antibiotic biosynthesis monooxygenase [Actinomadura sp. HBU206391]|uniref:antibiotic biosynthesis monooxygenase n=1 Tax=Actinomadura sp. HBU206391 TaxID=2731692 RepID=UPI00164FD30D|nr:antibiotic biosynthesis monooxygenase [Actinomadura sp. HBU206391]MBC6462371.1 antibiotic biosynthesis monooxygenase [Actinomadura sp. HBU206391]